MSTTTIDESATAEVVNKPELESEINTIVERESRNKTNREDLSYYYSSGNFNFIFEHGFKPETLESTELTKVPFLPDWYDGIISIHGLIIPVIDILKFTQNQRLNVTASTNKKSYLLKLEHPDHKPIVFKLETIPQLINMTQLKEVKTDDNSPDWINNYLQNDDIKLAFVDHNKLFDELIAKQ